MDITFLAICIIGISCFHTIQAGCVENLASDSNFKECKIGYINFVRLQDPSKMAKAVCSNKGRKRMKCMAIYIHQCPQLKATLSSWGGVGDMAQYFTPAGIESMCAMRTSVVPLEGDKCAEVKACVSKISRVFGMADKPGTTPYGRYREYIGTLCGGGKNIFMCIDNVTAECEDIVQRAYQETPRRYVDMRKYVMETCPKLPTGFLTDTCVKTQVESEAFLACYRNFERELDRTRGKTTCAVFLIGKTCIDHHVGKCGQTSADAISALMPFRVPTPGPISIISSCSFPPPPQVSSSCVLNVSLALLITITAFAGFRFAI